MNHTDLTVCDLTVCVNIVLQAVYNDVLLDTVYNV